MVILVMCTNPECCEFFHVSDQAAGTEVCCPSCGTAQRVAARSKMNASAVKDVIGTAAPAHREEIPPADDTDDKKPLPVPPSAPSAPAATNTTEKDYQPCLELEEEDDKDDESFDLSSTVRPANSPKETAAPVTLREISYELEDLDDDPPAEDAPEPDLEAIPSDEPRIRPTGSSVLFDTPVELTDMADSRTQSVDKDMLDLKVTSAIILSFGLVSILGGLILGLLTFPWHPLLNAYLGGGLGWIAGFTIAFLLIGAYQKNPERMRCGVCGCVFPIHATTCGLCGAPLSVEESSPMLWACLRAGLFAVRQWAGSLLLVFYVVVTYIILWSLSFLWTRQAEELQSWRLVQVVLDVVVVTFLASYSVRYFLEVIDAQYRTQDTMPDPPAYLSPSGLIRTLRVLLMLVMIALPLITFPLLMWMFLLLWSAGMLFGVLLVFLIFGNVADLFDSGDNTSTLLQGGILTIRAAVATVLVYCSLTAICRCIGKFGRFCPLT
jgi:hypothetical protein